MQRRDMISHYACILVTVFSLLSLARCQPSSPPPPSPSPSPRRSDIPLSLLPSCKADGNLPGKGWVKTCMNEIAIVSCPPLSLITSITSSFYGNLPGTDLSCHYNSSATCQYTNLTVNLSRRLVGLNNATLVVRGEILIGGQAGWLSDPCPGVSKSFNVTWCCGKAPVASPPIPLDNPPPFFNIDSPPPTLTACDTATPCPKGIYYHCLKVGRNDTSGNGNQGGCREVSEGPFPYGPESYQCDQQCLRVS